MPVDAALVKVSEATLLSKYPTSLAFDAARAQREASRAHVLVPRPKPSKPPPSKEEQAEKARKQHVAASQLYNPFEALKRPLKSGKLIKLCIMHQRI
jgi:hypothetical protein